MSKMSGSSLSPLKLNCAPNNRPRWLVAGQRGAGPGKLFTFRLHLHSTPVGVPALEVATDLSRSFTVTGEGPFLLVESASGAFTIKNLLRHYAC